MKKILVIVLAFLLVGCARKAPIASDTIKSTADFVYKSNTNSLTDVSIYFDSYKEINGKFIFYDKDGEYAGETLTSIPYAIGRNFNKVEE